MSETPDEKPRFKIIRIGSSSEQFEEPLITTRIVLGTPIYKGPVEFTPIPPIEKKKGDAE